MSASSASLNVLRWSSLGLGLVYGIYHQSRITSSTKQAEAARIWSEKEKLIAKAKQEFAAKKNGGESGVVGEVVDVLKLGLDDKGFDLDKWFQKI